MIYRQHCKKYTMIKKQDDFGEEIFEHLITLATPVLYTDFPPLSGEIL